MNRLLRSIPFLPRLRKRHLALAGVIVVLAVLLALFFPFLVGLGGDGPLEAKIPVPPIPEVPPPPPNEFRLEHGAIYHGDEVLTLNELVERSVECAERGYVVEITLVSYDQLHYNQLERRLDRANGVAYRVTRLDDAGK